MELHLWALEEGGKEKSDDAGQCFRGATRHFGRDLPSD